MKYITGKITLADGGGAQKEVYVFYKRFRNSSDNLLKVVQAEANGEFKVPIPKSLNYAEIHLAAPGYAAYMTSYIEGDTNPRIEATLSTRSIPTQPDSVSVFMSLKKGQGNEKFAINGKNEIHIEVDFSDEKYKAVTEVGEDTVTFTYYFGEITITPADHKGEWIYDYNGDYNAIAVTKNDKFIVDINLDSYRKSDNESQNYLTTGSWVNSPVNKQYNEVLETLPNEDVSRLGQNYYYYVHQHNKDAISKLSPEVIEERKQATINKFYRYIKSNDSLLAIVKSPYLKDYLNMTKVNLLSAPDSSNSWDDRYKVLKSLKDIPIVYYALFNSVIYSKEFKADPQKYIDILEKNYAKTKNKRNYNFLMYGLMATLARTELVDDPKYLKYITENLNEIAKYDDLDNWPKSDLPKTLVQLELKSMVKAPDFSFKTIDEKDYKLSDFKGKWVMLDFWGTWCGPCVMETPYLVDAYNKLGGENFEMISVASDRSVKVVSDYVTEKKMNWVNTVALDGYAEGVLEQYGITAFPTIMLLDPEGKFVKVQSKELRGENLIPTLEEKMGLN